MNREVYRVSIGMPIYNGELFVREALDSLLAQTYTDFELIISNNASTDATESICMEYAARDLRIRYIRQPINVGALANFKLVLNEARGDYFMWAAHDDRWSENWLSELFLAHQEQAVLTFGEVVAVDRHGEFIRKCGNLSFAGRLIPRSLRFAFQDGFKGKANLFYGLFKTNEIISVLSKEKIDQGFAVDALILFSVLQRGDILTVSGAQLYKRAGGAGDAVSRNYSMIRRITSSYLFPYYFGYVKRATTLALKCALCACIPFLFVSAYYLQLKRNFNQENTGRN